MQNYPMEASSSYYQQSPEMTLYGGMHMGPHTLPNSQVYSHQPQQPQIQNHWQPDPALQMGYQAIPMQTDNSQGSMSDQMMLGLNTGVQVGQYGLGSSYDYMTNVDSAYVAQQVYTPTPQELMSPQNVDPEGAWRSLYMQFGGAS